MAYRRILTIQDISCVGQCSMTVALPILSACGHETCIFPTAVLSTHTGCFGKPVVVQLEEQLDAMWKHWQENNILFDAVLVGYLGSISAVETAQKVIEHMLAPGGVSIVDPAMADHGKRYSGLSAEYAEKMESLCRNADIIIPNITEAVMFAKMELQEDVNETYVKTLLEKLNHPCVVLTGIGYEEGKTGAVLWDAENMFYTSHNKVNRNFFGTGDMFAACFTGALMQGKSKKEAVQIAAHFVYRSIQLTQKDPGNWYGVKFEAALPELIRELQQNETAE